MAMDTASTSTEIARRGGIEALTLKVGPVRRNLFGPVDHQQLRQDFQRILHMSVETANKRWNFDFRSDAPGPGSNVEWEELKCHDVPGFYHNCTVRPVVQLRAAKAPRRFSTSSSEESPVSSGSSGSEDEYLEVTTRRYYRLQKRKQAAITDFFKVKKRRLLHYKAMTRQ